MSLGVHVPPPTTKDRGDVTSTLFPNRAPAQPPTTTTTPPPPPAPRVVSPSKARATAHSSPTLMRGDRTGRFTRPLQWRSGCSQSHTQAAGGGGGGGGGWRRMEGTNSHERKQLKLTRPAEQLNVSNRNQSSEHITTFHLCLFVVSVFLNHI